MIITITRITTTIGYLLNASPGRSKVGAAVLKHVVMVSIIPNLTPSNATATFIQSTRMQRSLKTIIPVMLVFIGKFSLSTLR